MSDQKPGSDLPDRYHLRLFVAGNTQRSLRAIANLQRLCAEYIGDRVDLDVVDIYQQPEFAERDQVVAVPMLLKLEPFPVRRVVGDLTDKARVISALGLSSRETGRDGI